MQKSMLMADSRDVFHKEIVQISLGQKLTLECSHCPLKYPQTNQTKNQTHEVQHGLYSSTDIQQSIMLLLTKLIRVRCQVPLFDISLTCVC